MTHRAARPVDGREVGDPHWHVHAAIANMTRGTDGRWSTVAAGGRDLMRHAPVVDHVLKALVRSELRETFGVGFARSRRTGAWEVAAIPEEVLVAFSKRGASIDALLRDLGFDPKLATATAERIAEAQTRGAKPETVAAADATVRELWQAEARSLGTDPAVLARDAFAGSPRMPPQGVDVEEVVAWWPTPSAG
jgi:conjugative relaxase-like TrwC/TraI family protein